ncbi:MAG: hypothetical protein K6G01_00480 [Eubacterium sp.]|nr:hypothetical protein [Eubacterium sp.]
MHKTMADEQVGGWRLENQPWWQEYSKMMNGSAKEGKETEGMTDWTIPVCGSFGSWNSSFMGSQGSYHSLAGSGGSLFLMGYGLHLI